MSAALHMFVNGGDTEGLFRGAFMHSGALIPSGDISLGQQDYDDLVRAVGCDGAEDTLECLRQVPFLALKEAVNMSQGFLSYRVCHKSFNPLTKVTNRILQSMNLAWGPRADGTFLKAPLQQLVLQGNAAKIPFVTGDENVNHTRFPTDRSEYFRQLRRRRNFFHPIQLQRYVSGDLDVTLFLLITPTPRTDAQFEEYIRGNYFSTASSDEFRKVIDQYPSGGFNPFLRLLVKLRRIVQDVTQGSPYGTGNLNALTPQFKRIASIQGDISFQGPRRLFLEHLAHKQNAWSFGIPLPTFLPIPSSHIPTPVSNTTKSLPALGSVRKTFTHFSTSPDPLTVGVLGACYGPT